MKRLELILFTAAMFSFASCHDTPSPFNEGGEATMEHEDGSGCFPITFVPKNMEESDVNTKTSIVSSFTSFYASATMGGAGNEFSVWNSVSFRGTWGSTFTGNKYWPIDKPSFNFYASSNEITFNTDGSTVSAVNTRDVVCAYLPNHAFNAPNTLVFKHIFARIGTVTISAPAGYTVSSTSAIITPKTGGTYNIRTGEWSSVTTGIDTVLDSDGIVNNDVWLVPDTYTVTVSYTLTKGDYSESFSDMIANVTLIAGKTNNISGILPEGNTKEIRVTVTLTPWGSQSEDILFS